MKLYFAATPAGFTEANCVVLPPLPANDVSRVTFDFNLPVHVNALRFDPMEARGRFRVVSFTVQRRSQALRGALALVRAARLLLRSPRRFLRDVEQYVERRDGIGATGGAAPRITVSLPDVVPLRVAPVLADAKPHLNVLIPGMAMRAMSGGPNTALNLTLRLARRGIPVRYISTDIGPDSDETLRAHFLRITGFSDGLGTVSIVDGHDRSRDVAISPNDGFFCTAWWTVQMIRHVLPMMRQKKFIYFIQDFEPGLYAWSSRYALALETYSLDFQPIVNESLLLEHLVQNTIGRFSDTGFAARSIVFDPAVDRRLFYHERTAEDRPRTLLFYARPNAPRNLFELGLVALKESVSRGAFPNSEWQLLFIGENLPSISLPNGASIQPAPWLDYAAYAALLRRSDVGLALMLSPHTGYPTLEMAACGLTVVTNSFGVKTSQRLERMSSNILAPKPTVEGIADALVAAWHRAEDEKNRRQGATIGLPGSWDDVFEPRLDNVLQIVRSILPPAQAGN